MDVLRNNEEMVICPYNPSHHIRKYRVEAHLTKCRKSFKESEVLLECDFNACHRIPEPELQYHHETCPDRKGVELQVYDEEEAAGPVPNRPAIPPPVDDTWDDVEVPSYNPEKYCVENRILRRLDVESAAKRRDFRVAERHRINNLSPPKGTAPSRKQPADPLIMKDKPEKLPPTPSFSAAIEKAPNNIVEMMSKLNIAPKRAVIPKQHK